MFLGQNRVTAKYYAELGEFLISPPYCLTVSFPILSLFILPSYPSTDYLR